MSVVFVGGLDHYLLKVAAGLIRRGVPITCFLDRHNEPGKNDPVFDHVLKIDANQFRYPERIIALNRDAAEMLPAKLIEHFRQCESVFLSNADRYSFNVPVIERKTLYHELLLYFYHFLKGSAYRVIIFPSVPHDLWNNVLYAVARYLGIETLVIEDTLIPDRVIVGDDYERVPEMPADYLAGYSRESVTALLDRELRDEWYATSAGLQEAKENNQRALEARSVLALTWVFLVSVAGRAKRKIKRAIARQGAERVGDAAIWLLNEPSREWLAAYRRYRTQLAYRRLYQYYEERCVKPINGDRYVLFYLHFQPEKKTTPLGGVFEDQFMAVKMVSQSVPAGWFVYVREHPLQFKGRLDSQYYRSAVFYDRLAALPHLRLMSVKENQAQLIDGAQLTASVAGSVGWEGMRRGKPCLIFGTPWYTGCRSSYRVGSNEECRQAIADARRKDAAQVERDVLTWLVFSQPRLLMGATGARVGLRSKRTLEELSESLAAGLAPYISPAAAPAVTHTPVYEQSHAQVAAS